MAYIVPRVTISQEFTQVPVFGDQPLSALVFGPQFNLFRYNNTGEKASTAVTNPNDASLKNSYQYAESVTYDLPGQVAGTFVDKDFTKVFFDKAQVEYYPNDIDTPDNGVFQVEHPTLSGVYYSNRFQANDLVFRTANSVTRSDVFSNRDVRAGDLITIEDELSNVATVRVKALHATRESAVVGDTLNDAGNKTNTSQDYNNNVVWAGSGSAPGTPPVNSSAAYVGHTDLGIVADVYTVRVTYIGAGLSDTKFTVSSTNGAFVDKTNQTLDGSDVLIIDNVGGNDIKLDFTSATDPVVGDIWTLSVTASVVRLIPGSTLEAGSVYKGANDITYKLVVTRGGPLYDGSNGDTCAKITVFSDQLDSSAAVKVQNGTPFKVGSYGLTATISAAVAHGGLVLGDVYYIPVSAAFDSGVAIVETYESLPATLVDNSENWAITSMRYVTDLSVPSLVDELDDVSNWDVDADAQTITINSGITTTNDLIVSGNDPLALNVVAGSIFVEHRDLVVDNSISIGSVTNTAEIEAILGPIDPDNPLAQGVYHAVLNSNAAPTYFCGVATNDLEGYLGVLALAEKADTYYGLAPLTFDAGVRDAVVAHVNAQSTPENAKWRVAWLSVPLVETEVIYDLDSNDEPWKATITDDPLAAGTQYKLVTMAGAQFVTDGVRPTDRLRINFRVNGAGKTVFDTFTVSEVRTETTLVLTSASPSAINVAVRAEIERVYTKDEQIDKLALVGGEYNNRRVRVVFPPKAKSGSTVYDGYIVAAALSGLRGGVVPHQGLTNTVLLGFNDVSLAANSFTETQLNRLAAQGIWIVTQATTGATPYVRHQLTTDESSLNTSEDSITTNVDSISYGLMKALGPYIGIYNVHPRALTLIRQAIDGELNFRSTATYTVRAGNQLNSYVIDSFTQNPTFKDRVDAVITLDVPYPLNKLAIKLIV